MERFLTAKHWQIFMITFGMPILLEILGLSYMIMSNNPLIIVKMLPFIMFFFICGYFGWSWSVVTRLQSKVPQDVPMKVNKFKVFFFMPLIYIPSFFAFMAYFTSRMAGNSIPLEPGLLVTLAAVIVPLHLLSMFSMFYCLYFISKTIKTVELQREVTFSDFAGEFFMIWFFPIGIWFIQPKINKLQNT